MKYFQALDQEMNVYRYKYFYYTSQYVISFDPKNYNIISLKLGVARDKILYKLRLVNHSEEKEKCSFCKLFFEKYRFTCHIKFVLNNETLGLDETILQHIQFIYGEL